MMWLLTSKIGRMIGAVVMAILAVVTFGAVKKKEGRKEAENDFLKDKDKREAAARNRLNEGRRSGLSPTDRVRRNDGDWRGL